MKDEAAAAAAASCCNLSRDVPPCGQEQEVLGWRRVHLGITVIITSKGLQTVGLQPEQQLFY